MKKILTCLSLLFLASTVSALESPWEKKLPFKNATINYNITGTQKGTKTLYVKDYGRTTAEYLNSSITVFGMVQPQNEITITTPEWEYDINMQDKTGMKQVNPQKCLTEEFNKLSKADQKKVVKNIEKFGVSAVEGMQGKVEKNADKILGYKCDKVEIMGTTVYTIADSGLPLKTEANAMGMTFSETATSINKGAAPESKFSIPSGIKIHTDPETDEMIRKNAKLTIESLVSGVPQAMNTGTQYDMNSAAVPDDAEDDQVSREEMQQMQQMMKSMQDMFGSPKE